MSNQNPSCQKCGSVHAYPDGSFWVCPECFHEFDPAAHGSQAEVELDQTVGFFDANGVALSDGDHVVTIKDLKVGKDTLKSGTKVKNIKLLSTPIHGHDIFCKVPEFGAIYLKCSVVKKSN